MSDTLRSKQLKLERDRAREEVKNVMFDLGVMANSMSKSAWELKASSALKLLAARLNKALEGLR